ncbi:helix-turn-helix transcriptional regulator [Leucobacter tenebrionis]|uniref:helix-turn-helix transcriptional regulator n=1 Tax=Leucobacter tenebrionis TaxID=2873270 RepID=UPI002104B957|nr:LuxR family transcriptional regulator [Leucobacter tenebrionis]
MATGDSTEIAEVASRHIWQLFSRHFREFIAAVIALPRDVLREYPALYLNHPSSAVALRSTRPLPPSAFNSFRGENEQDEQIAVCRALQMIASRAGGDLITAVTYAKLLRELIRQERAGDTGAENSPIWFFHWQVGSTLLCAGDTGSALREFAIARQYGEVRENIDAIRSTAGREALAHAIRGSIDEAQRQLALAESLPPLSDAFHGNALSTERTVAALIAVERMDADVDERISALDDVAVFDVIWPFIFLARARHQLARRRPHDALETIRATTSAHLIQPGTLADDLITAMQIEAELVLGNVERANSIVESSSRPGPHTRLAQIQVALHDSAYAEARRLCRAASRGPLSPEHLAQLQLLQASLESLEFGEVSPGLASRVAELACSEQFRRLFTCTPASVIELVRARLTASEAAAFDTALAGLTFRAPMLARPALTPAERRVLDALTLHTTTAEVADSLGVSLNTVKTQLRSVFRKLGVSSRDEAIARAAQFSIFVRNEDEAALN